MDLTIATAFAVAITTVAIFVAQVRTTDHDTNALSNVLLHHYL